MNPNIELFRRTSPKKKLEVVQHLSDSELLSITPETVTRIIKETGNKRAYSTTKELWIRRDLQEGNNWNSVVESISLYKGQLYVDCYVQYSNTDKTETISYNTFFSRNDFQGAIKYLDRYENPQTYYYRYAISHKAKILRASLLTNVNKKLLSPYLSTNSFL